MDRTEEKAWGKLNLALDVLSKRPDGYHDMRMVMQTVDFGDELAISLRNDGKITVAVGWRYLPTDERNIAVKAARAFFERMGEAGLGADISIDKKIPVCAGMGGGSADGAAVLRALNRLTGNLCSLQELERLAESLGSDVPFCVAGGTVLAMGRGELLKPVSPLPDCFIVICKPRFSVSTPELFARLDTLPRKLRPDINGMLGCLEKGDLRGTAQRMFNVFEAALPAGAEEVAGIKRAMLDSGAIGAVMTGTGSAVFGLFDKKAKAKAARDALLLRYKEVFLTVPKSGY